MHSLGTLAVLPNLKASVTDDGRVTLTEKFISGMQSYVDRWPGSVVVLIEPHDRPSDNVDNLAVDPDDLSFGVDVTSYESFDLRDKLRSCAVALGGISYRQNHLAELCNEVGVPFVYGTEYTLKTRTQIIRAEERNPLVQARRILWEWNQERQNRAAIRAAAGIQCNGVPTYEAYRDLNENALLFFDTRVTAEMIVETDVLADRLARLASGEPLRIGFSGRLNRMKGADALLDVAGELKRRGVPFELAICGAGALEEELRSRIAREGLSELVELRGVLHFETELMPFVKRDIDLFVCCHRQGDPSCTYLETMSCGVPVVGYDNEAFVGLLQHVEAGSTVPMDDSTALAAEIERLHRDRADLFDWSRTAREFAARNTFEQAFARRIAQFVDLATTRPERQVG